MLAYFTGPGWGREGTLGQALASSDEVRTWEGQATDPLLDARQVSAGVGQHSSVHQRQAKGQPLCSHLAPFARKWKEDEASGLGDQEGSVRGRSLWAPLSRRVQDRGRGTTLPSPLFPPPAQHPPVTVLHRWPRKCTSFFLLQVAGSTKFPDEGVLFVILNNTENECSELLSHVWNAKLISQLNANGIVFYKTCVLKILSINSLPFPISGVTAFVTGRGELLQGPGMVQE